MLVGLSGNSYIGSEMPVTVKHMAIPSYDGIVCVDELQPSLGRPCVETELVATKKSATDQSQLRST